MSYRIINPRKRRITLIFLSIVGIALTVVGIRSTILAYEDIRFTKDPYYIIPSLEAKVWKLIDFPDSELLPVEKIQALFPLPENESERTAIADELIQLFMERVNPEYKFEKYFETSERYWGRTDIQTINYVGRQGMFMIYKDDDNPNKGTVDIVWLTNGVQITYRYRTDGTGYKQLLTTKSGARDTYTSNWDGRPSYVVHTFSNDEMENAVMLVNDKASGMIEFWKGDGKLAGHIVFEISAEDFADYRLAQANGEAPKRTNIKEIQKYIKKTKGG